MEEKQEFKLNFEEKKVSENPRGDHKTVSKRYEVAEDDETADLGEINMEVGENNVFETIDNDENKIEE